MTQPTHFLLGAIIGKVTGNYALGIASSTLVDLDHLQSYATHGLLLKPKKLWKALTDQVDAYGDQRGILHNIIVFAIISVTLIFLLGVGGGNYHYRLFGTSLFGRFGQFRLLASISK